MPLRHTRLRPKQRRTEATYGSAGRCVRAEAWNYRIARVLNRQPAKVTIVRDEPTYVAVTLRDQLGIGGRAAESFPPGLPRPRKIAGRHRYAAGDLTPLVIFAGLWRLGMAAPAAAEAALRYSPMLDRGGWLLGYPVGASGRWRFDVAADDQELVERLRESNRGAIVASFAAWQTQQRLLERDLS